ncbi:MULTISPECIES: hypothetical protein [unclassified Coleofasciculus]|uniref:hypothetical protein n=1 Tax=unclassified Coleofasciculus TaxID=2692782 RepID=UPI001882F72C|nr:MULTISPECIES: hypothetical protein [unclassified Coleofasciculus]MBE9124757.1 hypothetical protein [Coleofasciculus sp. LEGE 07081]MBE9148209.1 hypothetical protein [Coleofasciculus sp. LEGE 07092]
MACGGLHQGFFFASGLITLPAMSLIYGYGLPLVATVLIESFILCKRELIPYRKAFLIAGLLKPKHPRLAATVMSMQVGSFGIIPMAYYLMQLQG